MSISNWDKSNNEKKLQKTKNKTHFLQELALENRDMYDGLSLKGEICRKEEKLEWNFEEVW